MRASRAGARICVPNRRDAGAVGRDHADQRGQAVSEMPVAAQDTAPDAGPVRVKRTHFRARVGTPLSDQQVARESRLVRLAFARLGAEGARAFLNGVDGSSGRSPLALAIASAEGAAAAEHMLMGVPQAAS